MGKIKGNMLFSGSIGDITVCKDGTVKERVRHRRPSLTRKAMRPKCAMKGLMAGYKMIKDELKGTHENCSNGRDVVGMFVSNNSHRTPVWLTKAQCVAGASFVVDYVVSSGTLYRIEQHLAGGNLVCTDIVLAEAITPATTVGALAADILSHNPHFEKGDVLKLFHVQQRTGPSVPIPQVLCSVQNLRLDPADAALLSDVLGSRSWCRHEGFLALAEPLSDAAAAFIHVRVGCDGRLLASTQELLCVNPVAEPFTTEEAFDAAYRSFGGTEEECPPGKN